MTSTTATDRRVEYMPLGEIPKAERNPKGHDTNRIRASIARFGVTIAGVLDERTGRLVVGHGRLAVLEQMADEGAEPPAGVIPGEHDWQVPIVRGWASRDDAEAESYLLADNRLTELGGWDNRLLTEILDDLADVNLDLLIPTGYSSDDLDRMIREHSVLADRAVTGLGFVPTISPAAAPSPAPAAAPPPESVQIEDDGLDTVRASDGPREAEYVQVSWIVNADQRKTIRAALTRAQTLFGLATSAMALHAVAERFLAIHPDPDADEKDAA